MGLSAKGTAVFIASGTGHTSGLVPDPGGSSGTTKFLREDATFAVPSSSGLGSITGIVKATVGTDYYAPGTAIAAADIPSQLNSPLGIGITPTANLHVLGSIKTTALAAPSAPAVTVNTTGSTTFWYSIVAEDAAGNRTFAPSTTSVTNSAVAASINNTITWSVVAGTSKYYVMRNTVNAFDGTRLTLVGTWTSGALSFTDTVASPSSITIPALNTTGSISGTAGTFSGPVSGTTATFSSQVTGKNASFLGTNLFTSGSVSNVVGGFKGITSQTGDLLDLISSTSVVLYGFDKIGRPATLGTTPTIAAGTGAGTTPTVTVTGTDVAGLISIATGTTPSASAIVATWSASTARAVTPNGVILTPANAAAAALTGTGAVWEDQPSRTATVCVLKVGSTALTASTTYLFSYSIDG